MLRLFECCSSGDLQGFVRAYQALLSPSNYIFDIFRTSKAHPLTCIEVFSVTDDNDWSLLHAASANGHSHVVSFILQSIQDLPESAALHIINFVSNGHSALLLSAVNGFDDISSMLLREGAEIACTSSRDRNSLYHFCRTNQLQAAKTLLAIHGAHKFLSLASASDTNGYTSLHAAALMGNYDICDLLLRVKVPQTLSRDQSSPLHVACRYKQQSSPHIAALTVKTLLPSSSAYLTSADYFGSTPLHIAVVSNQLDIVRALLYHYPIESYIAQDNDGMHPIHISAQQIYHYSQDKTSLLPDALLIFQSLMHFNYPIDAVDYSNCTVLHTLCYITHPCVVPLVSSICDYFLQHQSVEKLQSLIATSASHGWTCLHILCSLTYNTITDSLLRLLTSFMSSDFMSSFDPMLPKVPDKSHNRRGAHNRIPAETRREILHGDYSLSGIAKCIKNRPNPRVIVLIGAGVSTAAGIKDFRSDDGLYADRNTANLFSTEYMTQYPEKFYSAMKSLFLPVIDGDIRPTKTHAFLRLLKDQGWLLRVYTQNIDMLEYPLLDSNDVVECHGSCKRAYCMNSACGRAAVDMEAEYWSIIRSGDVPKCRECQAMLRPDVTFFGEPLPHIFQRRTLEDFPQCDVLLVFGTSLLVHPVASLPQMVPPTAVRCLINRDSSGCFQHVVPCNTPSKKENADEERWMTTAYRDVFYKGNCDDAAMELAVQLDLQEEFQCMIKNLSK